MRVLRPSAHSTTTSPPRPPSPPSGPPNSMNFSRRNETQPAPPSPERTYTRAVSRNFIAAGQSRGVRQAGGRVVAQGGACRPPFAAEPEAVALHHAAARRRALQAGADERKSTLFQHALRGSVLDPDARQDLDRRGQPEAGVDHRLGGLCGKALAPSLRREHEAKRQAVRAPRFEADRADCVPFALGRRHDQGQVASRRVGFARRVNESLSRAGRIRVGDAGGKARDFPQAAKPMDRGGVQDSWPAQPKPLRLQTEHIVSRQIGEHGISGQRPVDGAENDEGDAATASPSQAWLAGRMSRLLAFNLISKNFVFENVRGACRRSGVLVLLPALFCRAWRAYRYILASVAFQLEGDLADGGGEQRMVRPHADIAPGVKLAAALAYKNHAADDALAAEL